MTDLASLYGAAFGFNTKRRIKPVHFATGFFVSLLERSFPQRLLNYTVAFADGREGEGDYSLEQLYETLRADGKLSAQIDLAGLHRLRKHLRCLADNDGGVYAVYGRRPGFGCDYSAPDEAFLTRTKDNDGFAGAFVHKVLSHSEDGRAFLADVKGLLADRISSLRQLFAPLLDEDVKDEDLAARHEATLGALDGRRLNRLSRLMAPQTRALLVLVRNSAQLLAPETSLRMVVVGISIWLFRYLCKEGLPDGASRSLLLADMLGDSACRMRAQSRWSYSRLREDLALAFRRFGEAGRFKSCESAWEDVVARLDGRPDFEEFYRELAVRSGLAQPRASRVVAKHFEPQPDTIRMLVLSALRIDEDLVSFTALLDRLFEIWGISFGGRPEDVGLLMRAGYTGLDQDHDLTPNADALVNVLVELGLGTRYSDGLIMCHSQPRFST